MYATDLPCDENTNVMAQLTEFFATKLVKKGMRQVEPFEDPTLRQCISEFREVVRTVVQGGLVLASEWETNCETFSNKWITLSHWVCPVRLAEFVKELGKNWEWEGTLTEKKKTPPKDFIKKKEKKDRVTAEQKVYHCPLCNIHCNSQAQMTIHLKGSRHAESTSSTASISSQSYEVSSEDDSLSESQDETRTPKDDAGTYDLELLLHNVKLTLNGMN
eukprot:TRINITY_DN7138_c1_g1_i1.p1 TRINITY_DN7138_c1_g1~~TRINITY_DN7138_c1_g1_i1.p1  ORF type:complete len:218 (+),score=31.24 TRINITY_DN7138_c1_g1_i1:55-708(+)